MSPEEIQVRIEKSQQKYREVAQVRKVYQAMLSDGRAFLHQNRYDIVVLHAGDATIGLMKTDDEVRGTLTFKNPKDQYSPRVARGILGHRFQTGLDFVLPVRAELLEELKEGMTYHTQTIVTAALQSEIAKAVENGTLPEELSFIAPTQ